MVKRRREEEIAGVLEFEGRTNENPEFVGWLEDHKARNDEKLRMSQGGRGVCVMFRQGGRHGAVESPV